MKRTVYLAGPILGRTFAEANDWRGTFSELLSRYGIIGVSPLRCEPLIGERYSLNYPDPRFGTPRAIASKNKLDVRMCDMTLCYFPEGAPFSKGTCGELFWANAFDKPTVLVSTVEEVVEHPVIQAASSWILPTLDDALDVISGVLSIYGSKP
jgi:nucleoside 2-deoxyribosyltransferase